MSIEKWLEAANNRLKHTGIQIEVRGKSKVLYLRGTFPNEPWKEEGKSQRRINLKSKAISRDSIQYAEATAREVALELSLGRFDWGKFIEKPDTTSIGYYVDQLRAEKQNTMLEYSWRNNYEILLRRLDLSREPTEDYLLSWIVENDPNCSTMRRKYMLVALDIAHRAGLSTDRILKLKRKNETKPINPRFLPSDADILAKWHRLHPHYKDVYALMATYGLRPHEVYSVALDELPVLKVLEDTKTGFRLVLPLPEEWLKTFQISESILYPPRLKVEGIPNWKKGKKLHDAMLKFGIRSTYELRHCYARRAFESGLGVDIAAKLMGHSNDVHLKTYRRWIEDRAYIKRAQEILRH